MLVTQYISEGGIYTLYSTGNLNRVINTIFVTNLDETSTKTFSLLISDSKLLVHKESTIDELLVSSAVLAHKVALPSTETFILNANDYGLVIPEYKSIVFVAYDDTCNFSVSLFYGNSL